MRTTPDDPGGLPGSDRDVPPEADADAARERQVRTVFERFAAEYTERAQTWLILIGAPSTDAQDRVQDALAALWARRFEVRPEVWPKWLRTAVRLRHEEARRAFRLAEKHSAAISYESELDAADMAASTPEEWLGNVQVCAVVRGLVDQLGPERRAVVLLYLFDEMPMVEAAGELGISEQAAWTRWRRARVELREMVERRRERERFAGGVVSFGVLFAIARRGWNRLRGSVRARSASAVFSSLAAPAVLAALLVGDTAMRNVDASSVAVLAASGTTAARIELPHQQIASLPSMLPVREEGAREEPGTHEPSAIPCASCAPQDGVSAAQAATANRAERMEAARAHLVRASAALHGEKNVLKALAVVEMYEMAFPEDPFPAQHAALRTALQEP